MSEETEMAKTVASQQPVEPVEEPVDHMAEAPKARPYAEAISDRQREMMAAKGITVR